MTTRLVDQAVIVYQPRDLAADQIQDDLLRVFKQCRDGLTTGRTVVVVLRDVDLRGHGEPLDAAIAHALAGLVRALATEGTRDGWQINAVAIDADEVDEQCMNWVRRLALAEGASGVVLRLGHGHLGRVGI